MIVIGSSARRLGNWTDKNSGGVVALVRDAVYQVTSDGFVAAKDSQRVNSAIKILTDSFTPPTTERQDTGCGADGRHSASCLIKKNDYVKITSQVAGGETIYWLPWGNGKCVLQ